MALPESPSVPKPVVAIVGGAVAGSEAAALCARRGAIAVVFEQGARPYGKIEDGLPRWHEKLREKEYERIDENLSQDGVLFVPQTTIGRDVSLDTLTRELGFSAVLLANGAWRDRPLPVDGIEAFLGRGLVYQNPFVQWFNHYDDVGYAGPTFDVKDGAIVIGGGLASIDVVKILSLELHARALRARGHDVDVVALEVEGIPETLKRLGVERESLGLRGASLYYRRRKEDMPLAAPNGDSPDQLAKAELARVKIMERVERKYLVRFEGLVSPVATIVENGALAGLRLVRNEAKGGRVAAIPGTEFDVRTEMIVSSIGSIPLPLAGIPSKGELYDYEDFESGKVRGFTNLFGLGNVLTGKGNIRDSRENASEIATRMVESYLGLAERTGEALPIARESLERIVDGAVGGRFASPSESKVILDFVARRWKSVGYPGSYRAYSRGESTHGATADTATAE